MSDQPATTMRDADWSSLAYSIAHGYCILMLGPDAFTDVSEGEPRPVFAHLGRQLKQLGENRDAFDDDNFRAIAEGVIGEDMLAVQSTALRTLTSIRLDDSVLGQLADMPFKLVINAAPGVRVDEVWGEHKPSTTTAHYDYRSRRSLLPVSEFSGDAPLVYHLYGSLDDPASLTLAESDLIESLVAVVAGNPDLPPNIRSVLRSPQHTFLFLGFRLQMWHLRLLLHVLAASDPKGQSYALQGLAGVDAATRQFYRQGHKLKFCDVEVDEFVAELSTQVRELAPAVSSPGPVPSAPRPSSGGRNRDAVFICHASDDKPQAEALTHALQAAGFETWFDKTSLRGGVLWDTEIQRTINEVRYFVVVQSDGLTGKIEGYVNKEIKLALERQMQFRTNLQFVVPVLLDDERNLLPELAHLQSVRLFEPGGVDQLVSVLSHDRERTLVR